MELQIKKVAEIDDVDYQKPGDAGIDLRASGNFVINLDGENQEITQESYVLQPQERILIKTGIKVKIPKGHWGNIRDRSGLAFKHGLHHLAGVIDETYRGEIGVVVVNLSSKAFTVQKNDRIAQMVITPYAIPNISYVDTLEESDRGETGFGNSGKH